MIAAAAGGGALSARRGAGGGAVGRAELHGSLISFLVGGTAGVFFWREGGSLSALLPARDTNRARLDCAYTGGATRPRARRRGARRCWAR